MEEEKVAHVRIHYTECPVLTIALRDANADLEKLNIQRPQSALTHPEGSCVSSHDMRGRASDILRVKDRSILVSTRARESGVISSKMAS